MKRQKRRRRQAGLPMFEGDVLVMPSAAAAKQVYQALLHQFLDNNPTDWSLVSGFCQNQPVLVFLWDPSRNEAVAARVAQLATDAGGQDMADEAKATFLSQLLARRIGLQAKEPFDTLTAHHPKGKPMWDLED